MTRRALLAGLAAAGTVALLSGCTLASAITPPVESALYPTTSDVGGSNGTIPIPSWVPADAVGIQIKQNTDTGASIMQFAVPAGVSLGGPCDASIAGNAAQLDDTWWPQTIPPEAVVCQDGWHLLIVSNIQVFAWTP